MADGALGAIKEAREEAYSTPLEDIDMSLGERFASDTFWPFFERLRAEAPIHYCKESEFGPYWSVTRYHDIVAVESNHEVFSSAKGISIGDNTSDFQLPMFIAMDPPKHDEQRKVVSPIVGTENLKGLASLIRERAAKIIDELPVGETFDWVDRVSVELTAQMLATLFGFPFEERRKLTYWSDLTTTPNEAITEDEWKAEMMQCLARFSELWAERVAAPPAKDLISMLAHGEATREMPPMEFLGNVLLLIVGGNDTTRNSISGGLIALNRHPEAYERLRRVPALIETMVPEIIRWQTPVAHMRRTATADFELGGQTIRAGDKVIMWYVSGNRDETAIEDPDGFIIDRPRPRQHLSFGFGIHRCVGMRLAEMQLRTVWEEILKRHPRIEVVGEPSRLKSCFLRGIRSLPVRIPSST